MIINLQRVSVKFKKIIDNDFYFDKINAIMIKIFIYILEGDIMTLKDAKIGSTVRIDSLAESEITQRLMTMGLIPGTRVEVLRSAPLGDPIAIRVRAYQLAIRKDDAEKISVSEVA